MLIGHILIYGYIYFFVVYYIVFFITLIYYIIIEEWFCKNRIPEWYKRAHRYVELRQQASIEEEIDTILEELDTTDI